MKVVPQVVSCWATGGSVDYVLRVVARDVASYQEMMDRLLAEEIGISRYFHFRSDQDDQGQPHAADRRGVEAFTAIILGSFPGSTHRRPGEETVDRDRRRGVHALSIDVECDPRGRRPCGGATLAEGIAVSNVGKLTLPVVRELVRDIILVDEALIERAVNAFLTLQKTMAEGAGAAGLAAMLAEPERFRGRKVGLILCGGNIDPRILASIMVRELERADRIVSFRLTIPDRPGILGQIATRLGQFGANILSVDHHRLFLDVPAKGAKLDVTMETRDAAHAEEIFAAFAAEGYQPVHMPSGTELK